MLALSVGETDTDFMKDRHVIQVLLYLLRSLKEVIFACNTTITKHMMYKKAF